MGVKLCIKKNKLLCSAASGCVSCKELWCQNLGEDKYGVWARSLIHNHITLIMHMENYWMFIWVWLMS